MTLTCLQMNLLVACACQESIQGLLWNTVQVVKAATTLQKLPQYGDLRSDYGPQLLRYLYFMSISIEREMCDLKHTCTTKKHKNKLGDQCIEISNHQGIGRKRCKLRL